MKLNIIMDRIIKELFRAVTEGGILASIHSLYNQPLYLKMREEMFQQASEVKNSRTQWQQWTEEVSELGSG